LERTDIGSLISYILSFQGPQEFDAGFVLPSGELSNTFVLPIPLGQSASVVFAVKPKTTMAENNYHFTINADSSEQGLHAQSTLSYFYTRRRPPTLAFTPERMTVEAGRVGKFYADIKNNDPEQCSEALFYFSKEVPSGWTARFSIGGQEAQNILIEPQATVRGLFEVQSSASSKKENNISIAIAREMPQEFLQAAGIRALAKDGSYIYFTTQNSIKKVMKAGGSPITISALPFRIGAMSSLISSA
jgi:uncharacterized membrane protein